MQNNNGINDPINHKLTREELNLKEYGKFLDNLTDVPSSIPLRPFTVDKAGIVSQSAYVYIKSLFSEKFVPILCQISMQVELHGHRGIHMSRCEQALFELVEKKHSTLEDFSEKLAKKLLKKQEADRAYVSVEGLFIGERKTKKSKLPSHDKMQLTVDTIATCKRISSTIGVAVYNITGCPCTETFTKFSIVPELVDSGFNLDEIKKILSITKSGTHTQRGLARLKVSKDSEQINHKKLFTTLDKSCHLVFELLKRPDEHELVIRALSKPQFTEDVVREIAENCLKDFSAILKPSSKLFISSLLYDSIHIHDVYTEIEKSIAELSAER